MKIRTKIFLGFFAIIGVGLYLLIDWIVDDLTPRYRESTEEPLVDSARLLASIAATGTVDGKINTEVFRKAFDDVYSRVFEAKIYNFVKTDVDFRVYITNNLGTVIFDSDGGRDEGKDYSQWLDVSKTLGGEYGARTSRDTPAGPKASVLYVAAPILVQGEIVGVLTVGKPTKNANLFIETAKRKIISGGAVTGLVVLLTGLLISSMVTRPLQALTDYANAIRDGKRVTLPKLSSHEISELGSAFEEMRDALEGKQYVENYVQTLTHELKSPLSAIQGAVELLGEDMPPERREQFFQNIRSESGRMKDIVEKLLLLSSLENRKTVQAAEEVRLLELAEEIQKSLLPISEAKHLNVTVTGDADAKCRGERFLIRHAVVNLIQNAIEFSPEGGNVGVSVACSGGWASVEVSDSGPGIPEYAQERVFDRFYSLQRPDTGKKSSGLGLSLVKEVAAIHHGSITLANKSDGGVRATLKFPQLSRI